MSDDRRRGGLTSGDFYKIGFIIGMLGLGGASSGCYVASMVYGDYNAPEVMVLRKFRDEVLVKNFFGRVFIRLYYLVSPVFVKIAEKIPFLKKISKKMIDKLVLFLEKKQA